MPNLPGSPEVWLSAAVWVFYLVDSLRLVYYNEVLVEVDLLRTPSIHLHLPSNALKVGRRHIALLPLVTPHAPAFRVAWMSAPDASETRTPCAEALAVARRVHDLAAPSVLLWATLLVGLPTWLALGEPLFGLFVLWLALMCEWRLVGALCARRGEFGLSGLETAQMVFECIVCPPNAINLPRRLAARLAPRADLLAWLADGPRLRAPDADALLARIGELNSLSGADEDERLQRYREALGDAAATDAR